MIRFLIIGFLAIACALLMLVFLGMGMTDEIDHMPPKVQTSK